MRNREHEVILGAVVFVAAVILVVGTVWLSERYAGASGGYRVRVQFEAVPGLQVGNPVTFRGVWVGKVLGISLESGQPIVTLGFAKFDALPVDSKIVVKADGLLGGQMIEIQVGASTKTLADNALVLGETSGGLEQVMEDGGQLVARVSDVVEQLGAPENIRHLGVAIAHFDSSAQQFNGLLTENRHAVQKVIQQLEATSLDAQGILHDNRTDIKEAVGNLKQATGEMAQITQNMKETSVSMKRTFDNLDQITGQMREGKGTVGKLIQDDGVYKHLDRTLTSVDSLVEDIKRDPSRYFKFSVF
jgi:phospholipid/cholesterol/gamma-HCH transport system substrate-binding protein